jgi:hypothetical protein
MSENPSRQNRPLSYEPVHSNLSSTTVDSATGTLHTTIPSDLTAYLHHGTVWNLNTCFDLLTARVTPESTTREIVVTTRISVVEWHHHESHPLAIQAPAEITNPVSQHVDPQPHSAPTKVSEHLIVVLRLPKHANKLESLTLSRPHRPEEPMAPHPSQPTAASPKTLAQLTTLAPPPGPPATPPPQQESLVFRGLKPLLQKLRSEPDNSAVLLSMCQDRNVPAVKLVTRPDRPKMLAYYIRLYCDLYYLLASNAGHRYLLTSKDPFADQARLADFVLHQSIEGSDVQGTRSLDAARQHLNIWHRALLPEQDSIKPEPTRICNLGICVFNVPRNLGLTSPEERQTYLKATFKSIKRLIQHVFNANDFLIVSNTDKSVIPNPSHQQKWPNPIKWLESPIKFGTHIEGRCDCCTLPKERKLNKTLIQTLSQFQKSGELVRNLTDCRIYGLATGNTPLSESTVTLTPRAQLHAAPRLSASSLALPSGFGFKTDQFRSYLESLRAFDSP